MGINGIKKGRTSCGLPEEMVDHFKVAVLVANEIVKGLRVGFRREFGVLNCGHCISNFKEEERKKERRGRRGQREVTRGANVWLLKLKLWRRLLFFFFEFCTYWSNPSARAGRCCSPTGWVDTQAHRPLTFGRVFVWCL